MIYDPAFAEKRKSELKSIAETYFQALRNQDFSVIPYDDNVILRVPLVPGGVNTPVHGIEAARSQWWNPLVPALKDVDITLFDHYINDTLTAIITEAAIVLANPPVTLRAADRFTISDKEKIIEQENHVDVSSLRHLA